MAPNFSSSEDLSPYQNEADRAELRVRTLMASGTASIDELAIAKAAWVMGKAGLKGGSRLIAEQTRRDLSLSEIKIGDLDLQGPDKWMEGIIANIMNRAFYETLSPDHRLAYANTLEGYKTLGGKIKNDPNKIRECMPAVWKGPSQWFYSSDAQMKHALDFFADELVSWSRSKVVDKSFLTTPPEEGIFTFVQARPVPLVLLRLSQFMPWDKRESLRAPSVSYEEVAAIPAIPEDSQDIDLDSKADISDILGKVRTGELKIDKDVQQDLEDLAISHDLEDAIGDVDMHPDFGLHPQDNREFLQGLFLLAVGLVPILSQTVDIIAIQQKRNMFGESLSDFERATMLFFLLLPALGKGFKAGLKFGKPILIPIIEDFSAHAGFWKGNFGGLQVATAGAMQPAEDAAKRLAFRMTKASEEVVIAEGKAIIKDGAGKMAPAAKQKVATIFKDVFEKKTSILLKPVALFLRKEMAKIIQKYPVLRFLEAEAFERIVCKFNKNQIKGQILEEIMGEFIARLLKSRRYAIFLDIEKFLAEGWKLEHVAGHRIRDIAMNELTDGLLVLRYVGKEGDEKIAEEAVIVIGVLECKSGKDAARELTYGGYKSFKDLPEYWRHSILADAREIHAARRIEASKMGQKYTKKLETVVEELFREGGSHGQFLKDFVRIKQSKQILIDGIPTSVQIIKGKTLWLGFVPDGLSPQTLSNMYEQLQNLGLTNSFIRVLEIDYQVLDAAADDIYQLAKIVYSKLPK